MSLSSPAETVLSGMRVSGKLHLGHYHGVLKNWLSLQEKYDCFFFAADLHGLTTHYADPYFIREALWEMLIDWLAVGVNPEKATIFIQSQIPALAEFHLLLSMNIPLSWLERVPTYKDQIAKLSDKDLHTYGFLGYPALMSADILLYRAKWVPVGEDQLPHLEITREIARRFQHFYGHHAAKPQEALLVEPQALLTPESKFPGLDGQKMSKSYGNAIYLRDSMETVEKKINTMPTDPARVRRTDPGNPEKCPVWSFHKVYSSPDTQRWVTEGCQTAKIGCLECKRPVLESIKLELQPLQIRIKELEANPQTVQKIAQEGAQKAQETASNTLKDAKIAMGMQYC